VTKKTTPLVSINIPCYNGQATLKETVVSALKQTYENFEIIIVDDCSTGTPLQDVIAELPAGKIKLVRHEQNRGLPAARNTAVEHSAGQILLPLDCDDLLEPTFLEETVGLLQSNKAIDAVFTDVQIFGSLNMLWSPEPTMINLMCGIPIQSTVLMRRALFEKLGGYNTNLKLIPDSDFWLRALRDGARLEKLPKPLYHYRKEGTTMSDEGRHIEVVALAEVHPELYKEHLLEVLRTEEAKYRQLKNEYSVLEAGFNKMDNGYKDLLMRYDDVVARLQHRSVRYQLNRIMTLNRKDAKP
jgi:glycosyltransferase involved in cell wall biosynthesis